MSTYQVTVERDGRYWFIRIDGVGATQARHLREVETMARDLVAIVKDVEPDSFQLDVDVLVPEGVRAHIDASKRLREEASDAQAAAAQEIRAAARELADQGMTMRDVGALLGVSYQRAHQLVRG